MDLSRINKFKDFVSTNKYASWDYNFKLTDLAETSNIFSLGKNDVILTLGSNITIFYNKKTTKITCIFLDEIEYIQSKYYLLNSKKIIIPYIKFMLTNVPNSSNCLVIGLCLGNIPNSLIELYPSTNRIDCVDISDLLCKFYKKYLCASSLIHVYCMSGYQFVKSTKRSYSSVFIDIPCEFITNRFISLIDKITSPYPDRLIQINVIGKNECQKINEKLFSNFNVKKKQVHYNLIYVLN
jgi:hypothetical protein